jgi:hypothetical protein
MEIFDVGRGSPPAASQRAALPLVAATRVPDRNACISRFRDDHADTVTAVGTIHQIKVTLREVHPPVWRRVHLPSTATLDQLHEVIQVAMGWQQHHLHLFGKGDAEYGDNARDETKVTLAALIPQVGDWLGYRYDFGDMWDHDLVVEKVHRPAAKAVYPRCSAGGRACPPEDGVSVAIAENPTDMGPTCTDRAWPPSRDRVFPRSLRRSTATSLNSRPLLPRPRPGITRSFGPGDAFLTGTRSGVNALRARLRS